MESSTRTEELERAGAAAEATTPEQLAATAPMPIVGDRSGVHAGAGPSDGATTPLRPSLGASIREQCPACGAAMASDQRYCVECGQRRGPARVPLLDGIAQRAREAPGSPRPRRLARMSANSTLIAGIGTLLLALGVGVLIGRGGNSSSAKAPPAQVITVAGGGSAGTASTSAATQPATSAVKAAKSHAGASAASVKAAAKAKGPPPKVVTVGTPGKGPGYQKGHFTGNFFGPEAEGK